MANNRTYEQERLMTQVEKDHEDFLTGYTPEREAVVSHKQYGLGSVVLAIAVFTIIYAIYTIFNSADVIMNEIATPYPLTFFTNPVWLLFLIPLSFYHYLRGKGEVKFFFVFKAMSLGLLVVSLPMITAFFTVILVGTPSLFFGGSEFEGLRDTATKLYIDAYGSELGPQLMHFYFEETFGIFGAEDSLIFSLKALYVASLVVSFLFMQNLFSQVIATKVSGKSYIRDLDPVGDYLWLGLVCALTYAAAYPLIEATSELHFAISSTVVWSVLLFPFLGFRLAQHNLRTGKDYKVGKIFTIYYIIFWIALVGFTVKNQGYDDFMIFAPLITLFTLIRGLK